MPEPKTLPYGFTPSDHEAPSAAHYAWLGHAERLLSDFERDLPALAVGQAAPSLGFILMAADYLWDHHGEAAHYARLDVQAFSLRCQALLCREGVAVTFCDTLIAFYAYLSETREVDPGVAQAISAQLLALRDELTRHA
jgi:hypothetical protein